MFLPLEFLTGSTGDPEVDAYIIKKFAQVDKRMPHIYVSVLFVLIVGTLLGLW